MAVVAARNPPGDASERHSSEFCVELGIVNNMPEKALNRTERQFFNLLASAAHDILVCVSFYSLPNVAQGTSGCAHFERHYYRNARDLPEAGLDALIITGTEPRSPDLRCEPYWCELTNLFDWIADTGPSTLFSCLAAHAAVLHYDGIERRRLDEKRFGVFEHVVAGHDVFTERLSAPFRNAHSRWHEVDEAELATSGYRILTWAPDAGVGMFLKRGRNDLLFSQGHPEYDGATLGREYKRDVRRYLLGESEYYPSLPKNYFNLGEQAALLRFCDRAHLARNAALLAEYPAVRRRRSYTSSPAASVFRAWLAQIVEAKRRRRATARVTGTPPLKLATAS